VFGWFYFSINLGAFASMLLTPYLRDRFGPHVAFGVPGVLMFAATAVFWSGRYKFIHIPPGGLRFDRQSFSVEGLRVVGRLAGLYLFVAVFWCLFDQTGAAWIGQARRMNRQLWAHEVLPDQVQAFNSLLVLSFIPLFTYVVYPAISRFFPLTPLRKISIGLFLAGISYAGCAGIEHAFEAGHQPHIAWQLVNYVVLTAAEIMVSITCLEYSYTQAPKTMKSFVMAVFFLSVSLGNLITWAVNRAIQDEAGQSIISESSYYWLFTCLMLATAVGFIFFARNFREQTHLQDEERMKDEG
jgi:POT family proton-dependent oligopeptide transporter